MYTACTLASACTYMCSIIIATMLIHTYSVGLGIISSVWDLYYTAPLTFCVVHNSIIAL